MSAPVTGTMRAGIGGCEPKSFLPRNQQRKLFAHRADGATSRSGNSRLPDRITL
jgi:hypothetical protein